jgi:hypothetical protein
MFDKMVDAFARIRLGFVAAAAVAVLAAALAFFRFTGVGVTDFVTAIDFTDLAADVAIALVAFLVLVLIIWGFAVGTHVAKPAVK